jgi:hypothetical protein
VTDNNASESNASDGKSPGDRLLELVVFGPAGLAVTIVEEFPKLVEKGRHRVEGQVHTARLVGQFAFQMGRRQIEESLGRLGGRHEASESQNTPHPGADHVEQGEEHGTTAPSVDTSSSVDASPPSSPARTQPGPIEAAAAPSVWVRGGAPNGTGSPSALAIPGYDSLSASQVVQRLEGLSPAELEEVRAHEAAHRQRRTILHRVEQLLAGGHGVQP